MPSSELAPRSTVAMVVVLGLLLAAGLAVAAAPDLLLPNGGFEDGAAGWSASAGQLVIVTDPVRSGDRAGRLEASGQNQVAFLESGFVTVTAGRPYSLTGAVFYTDTAVAWTQLRITWFSDTISTAMPNLTWSTPVAAPAAGWQAFSPLLTTPPAGAHAAKVRAVVGLAALNQAGHAVFDDLSVQGPSSPTPIPVGTETATPRPSRTPTPTATPALFTTALPGEVLISEVQAHPALGGNSGEWLELYNRTGTAMMLAGWSVEDNHGVDPLPSISLPSGAFVVAVADEAMFRALFPGFSGWLVVIADGMIGNGLADDGDRLLLRDGAGTSIDALSYGTDVSVFDPAAPAVTAGHSLERWQPAVDTETAADFADNGNPSPGQPLPTPTATVPSTPTRTVTPSHTPTATRSPTATASPTATWRPGAVLINEFLPAPHEVDWDGDGSAGSGDEWIELRNGSAGAVDLGGWRLDDAAASGSPPYLIPAGQWIPGGGFLIFFHRQTGLTLNNDGDSVCLLYPDGSLAEAVAYGSARYDASYSKTGSGAWTWDYPPSPGGPNLAPPTPSPRPTATELPVAPISHARGAARDAAVAVEGRVTVPPGVFGRRVAYITDGTAGVRLQHWGRDLPDLAEGDAVHVEGVLTTVYGEVTLNVRAISRMGGGQPVPPVVLARGQMGSWWEGMLVRAAGSVQRWDSDDIFLDDGGVDGGDDGGHNGGAPLQVRLRASTGLERPALAAGQHLSVTGVVGQSNGVWLLLPRWQSDLSTLPARLPATGERGGPAAPCIAPLVGIYYPSPGGAGGCPAWWYR
jgi:hypothetical protein